MSTHHDCHSQCHNIDLNSSKSLITNLNPRQQTHNHTMNAILVSTLQTRVSVQSRDSPHQFTNLEIENRITNFKKMTSVLLY